MLLAWTVGASAGRRHLLSHTTAKMRERTAYLLVLAGFVLTSYPVGQFGGYAAAGTYPGETYRETLVGLMWELNEGGKVARGRAES